MKKIRVILSGGGTGGHIFPAIAIAGAIKKMSIDSEILFVGAKGKMEMEKVPQAGYRIEGLWISGLQRSFSIQNLLLPFKIIHSFLKARQILKKFKPHVVVGTGGYASWAITKAAHSLKIPTLIQEQNSFPGKSNLNLAKQATKICVAYPDMEKYFPKEKLEITGNPVRQDIQELYGKRETAINHFKLSPLKKTVLVIGGSLGARTINQSVLALIDECEKHQTQLLWQTGKSFFGQALEATKGKDYVHVFQFIKEMDLAYATADIVVSRAGAISISEICVAQKPAILIPSPNVAEDHQTKNAKTLVDKEAALMIEDNNAVEKLKPVLFDLINNQALQQKLSQNIKAFAFTDAANKIAELVFKIAQTDAK